ncbi:hypothetical protein [Azospirillum halopraeferens]|uniref:hypothetical protein n=1 Tax=Azospirillum halopraeferens TaxID=34010 RepID=UPI000423D89A|nr:hypothetical protein [Azospirillum halopraeferens]
MRIVSALLACLLLTACSGEPSEAEMRTAVEAHTRRTIESQGRSFSRFDAFRKQGCVTAKSRPDGYDCYYAATLQPLPGQPTLTVNGKGWFRRTDRGMEFADLGAQPR